MGHGALEVAHGDVGIRDQVANRAGVARPDSVDDGPPEGWVPVRPGIPGGAPAEEPVPAAPQDHRLVADATVGAVDAGRHDHPDVAGLPIGPAGRPAGGRRDHERVGRRPRRSLTKKVRALQRDDLHTRRHERRRDQGQPGGGRGELRGDLVRRDARSGRDQRHPEGQPDGCLRSARDHELTGREEGRQACTGNGGHAVVVEAADDGERRSGGAGAPGCAGAGGHARNAGRRARWRRRRAGGRTGGGCTGVTGRQAGRQAGRRRAPELARPGRGGGRGARRGRCIAAGTQPDRDDQQTDDRQQRQRDIGATPPALRDRPPARRAAIVRAGHAACSQRPRLARIPGRYRRR